MREQLLYQRGNTLVRRLRLEPGDAMPWQRDTDDVVQIQVSPGLAGWDEPTDRPHRGVNVGDVPYEEVTIFFLDHPDAIPQPPVD